MDNAEDDARDSSTMAREILAHLVKGRVCLSIGDIAKCLQQLADLTAHVNRLTSAIEQLRGESAEYLTKMIHETAELAVATTKSVRALRRTNGKPSRAKARKARRK